MREIAAPVADTTGYGRAIAAPQLDGILAVDRITDIKTLCTREEFERRYRPSSTQTV